MAQNSWHLGDLWINMAQMCSNLSLDRPFLSAQYIIPFAPCIITIKASRFSFASGVWFTESSLLR